MSPSLCCQLCASVRALLPRFHHLRLRMQFLCPAYLLPFDSGRRPVQGNVGGEESTTNHFLRRTVAGQYEVDTVTCGSRRFRVTSSAPTFNSDQMATAVIKNARQLYLSGGIPDI